MPDRVHLSAVHPNVVYLLHALAHEDVVANGKPFQAIYTGKFFIRHIGELEVTSQMLAEMVANFQLLGKNPPRVPLETNHQGRSGDLSQARAIGWVVDAEIRQDAGEQQSLMLTPSWSDEAKEIIETGGMRYCSLGFERNAIDPATQQNIGCALRECSVTNHPAWPGLEPIQLSMPIGGIDPKSKALLTAMDLANGVGPNGEPDLLDIAEKIVSSFAASYPDSEAQSWAIKAIFPESSQLVCRERVRQVTGNTSTTVERLWMLGYSSADDGAVSFAPRDQWQEVEQKFVPTEAKEPPATPAPVAPGPPPPQNPAAPSLAKKASLLLAVEVLGKRRRRQNGDGPPMDGKPMGSGKPMMGKGKTMGKPMMDEEHPGKRMGYKGKQMRKRAEVLAEATSVLAGISPLSNNVIR